MLLKSRKIDILMAIFILSFSKPTVIDVTPFLQPLNFLFDLSRIIIILIAPIVYFLKKKKSIAIFSLLLLYVFFVYSTFKNHGAIFEIALRGALIISGCLLAQVLFDKYKLEFIKKIKYVYGVYILFNLITMVIFPNGWYRSGVVNPEGWFLGNKNEFIVFILPFLFSCFLIKDIKNRKFSIFDKICISSSILCIILSTSSTGLVGVGIFFLVYFLRKYKFKIINATMGLITSLSLSLLIVGLNLTKLFSFFIVNILKKDLTLTVRTYVWKEAIKWFGSSPIIGVGNQSTEIASSHMFGYYHPHCTYLYYLVFSGIIGFSLFLIFLILVSKNIDRITSKFSSSSIALYWSVLIIWITEVYARAEIFFIILVIASSVYKLNSLFSRKKGKYESNILSTK